MRLLDNKDLLNLLDNMIAHNIIAEVIPGNGIMVDQVVFSIGSIDIRQIASEMKKVIVELEEIQKQQNYIASESLKAISALQNLLKGGT